MKRFQKADNTSKRFLKSTLQNHKFVKYASPFLNGLNELISAGQQSGLNGASTDDFVHASSAYSTRPQSNFEPSNRLKKLGNALERLPINNMKKQRRY